MCVRALKWHKYRLPSVIRIDTNAQFIHHRTTSRIVVESYVTKKIYITSELLQQNDWSDNNKHLSRLKLEEKTSSTFKYIQKVLLLLGGVNKLNDLVSSFCLCKAFKRSSLIVKKHTKKHKHYVRFSRFYWHFEIMNRKTGF